MTMSLAMEVKESDGVAVFVFGPGMVDTPGFTDALPDMARLLGMSAEEIIGMGVNPGYAGLMPAADCAAGLAHAIVHGREHHGQVASPFQPLIQAGLIAASPHGAVVTPDAAVATPAAPAPADVTERVEALKAVIATVDREFAELDFFKRAWCNRTFSQDAGMSIGDWRKTAETLGAKLGQLEAARAAGNPAEADRMLASLAGYGPLLERLAMYFSRTEKDAKGWIKDQHQLAVALEAIAQRQQTVGAIKSTLAEVTRAGVPG